MLVRTISCSNAVGERKYFSVGSISENPQHTKLWRCIIKSCLSSVQRLKICIRIKRKFSYLLFTIWLIWLTWQNSSRREKSQGKVRDVFSSSSPGITPKWEFCAACGICQLPLQPSCLCVGQEEVCEGHVPIVQSALKLQTCLSSFWACSYLSYRALRPDILGSACTRLRLCGPYCSEPDRIRSWRT